jgi:EpsI family protein
LIWRPTPSNSSKKKASLKPSLANIKGWEKAEFIQLSPKIVKFLELDTYTNQSYSNGKETIHLYIGYYFTSKKVGAAHDPMVCFPGQGWALSAKNTGEIVLDSPTKTTISYSSMTAQLGQRRELVVYWFQSYDQANNDTFSQKITTLWKKLRLNKEDNAFVRISTTIGDKSLPEAYETINDFIRAFYPVFLDYVKNG